MNLPKHIFQINVENARKYEDHFLKQLQRVIQLEAESTNVMDTKEAS